MLKWLSSLFTSSSNANTAVGDAVTQSNQSTESNIVTPKNSASKKQRLPEGPDCCYDEPGKCYRCGKPAGEGLYEKADFYRNVRVGEKYPDVIFEHKTLQIPLCSNCAAHEVSHGWGYFIYIQRKGYNSWNRGVGPSKEEINLVWQNFLHPKKNIWIEALEQQKREAAQRMLSEAHILDMPIAHIDQYEMVILRLVKNDKGRIDRWGVGWLVRQWDEIDSARRLKMGQLGLMGRMGRDEVRN